MRIESDRRLGDVVTPSDSATRLDSTIPRIIDFALPTAFSSFVVAAFLLFSPRWSLSVLTEQSAKGHLFWLIAGVAACINVGTYVASIRTKLSLPHLLSALSLASGVVIVQMVLQSFFSSPAGDLSLHPLLSPHAAVETFARSYFELVTDIFVPSVLLVALRKAAILLFDDQSEKRGKSGPSPVPG